MALFHHTNDSGKDIVCKVVRSSKKEKLDDTVANLLCSFLKKLNEISVPHLESNNCSFLNRTNHRKINEFSSKKKHNFYAKHRTILQSLPLGNPSTASLHPWVQTLVAIGPWGASTGPGGCCLAWGLAAWGGVAHRVGHPLGQRGIGTDFAGPHAFASGSCWLTSLPGACDC